VGRGAPPCCSQRYCEVDKAMSGLGTQARYNPSVSPKGEPPPFTQGRLRDWLPPGAGECYPGWGYDPCREGTAVGTLSRLRRQLPLKREPCGGWAVPLKREPWWGAGACVGVGAHREGTAGGTLSPFGAAPSEEGALWGVGSLGGSGALGGVNDSLSSLTVRPARPPPS